MCEFKFVRNYGFMPIFNYNLALTLTFKTKNHFKCFQNIMTIASRLYECNSDTGILCLIS